jgi:DNA-binding CsgD family transcriptional regulator
MNVAGPGVAASSAQTGETQIFGRDAELQGVSAFLDVIPHGPHTLLLEGEAGVGKTTIWRWALERAAAAGFRVLSCRPAEAEASWSYAALADLLAGVDVPSVLPGLQRDALEIALLRQQETGGALDPRAIAVAVLASLRALAGSEPILLAVDDVQWLDAPSSRVLQFAVRRLRDEAIGVLVAERTPGNGSVPLGLDRAVPEGHFSRLELGPLNLGALHHALRTRLGAELPRAALVRLHKTTGGNPFYALEIARHLSVQGAEHGSDAVPLPRSLYELVARRLTGLPRRTQDLLLTVAALAHPTLALVTAAAQRPELVEGDIDRAVRGGVLEVEADRVRFTHPLLAAVKYEGASPGRRRALHRRLAELVTEMEERARHLALAATGPDETVAGSLDEAARRVRARGAPEAAAALLEEAVRLTPPDQAEARWQRSSDAAMCHYLAGDTERAREQWEGIEAAAPAGSARAAALWHLSEFRHSSLDLQQQMAAAGRALREAGADLALKSAVHHTLGLTLAWGGDVRQAQSHTRSALQLAEAQPDPTVLAMARTAHAHVTYLAGQGISTELIDRTASLERATRHLPLENSPRMAWAIMLAHVGEAPDAARREFAALRRQAQESGLDVSLPLLLFFMSDLECRTGDWPMADRYATESIDAATRSEQLFRAPLGLLARALLDGRRGRLDVARAAADEALSTARYAARFVEARIWAVLGFIELSRDDPESAHRWLKQVVDLEESGGYGEPTAFRCVHDYIEALIALGKLEEAARLVDQLESRGRSLNRAWALATGARCRGLLAAARGDLGAAQSALERAVQEHDRLPEPFELARTLLALGNVQRRGRLKRAAIASLKRAAEISNALGAVRLARRAEAEMLRAGPHPASQDELTATEERVARLVAAGRTNREIASALFVSVKAVEANLTRVYAKLGVRSRTELAVRLGTPRI